MANDFNSTILQVQLQLFHSTIQSTGNTIEVLFEIIKYFKVQIKLMSEVSILLQLVLVMPAISVVSEMSFSATKIVKHTSKYV